MTDTWTLFRFHTVVLARAGTALDESFTAPVSGWWENHGDGWTLTGERDVPECPRLQCGSAPADHA